MRKKFKLISIFSIILIFLFSLVKPTTYAWGVGDIGSIAIYYVDEDGNELLLGKDDNGNPRNFDFVFGPAGKDYEITVPTYPGYSPDKPIVSGQFNGDVNTTVTYYKINTYYKLTINCKDQNGNILKTLEYDLYDGQEYNIDLDIIDGMTPEISTASGTIKEDTTINVTYSYKTRIVIIHFYDVNYRRLLYDEIVYFEGNGYLTIYPPRLFGYYNALPIVIYVDRDLEVFISYRIVCNNYCYIHTY